METIYKSTRLQNVRYDVRGAALVEAEKLMAQDIPVMQLNTGNPAMFGFTAPDDLFGSFLDNAWNAQAYSQSKGVLSAREAISEHYEKKGIPNISVKDIYIGNGVSELIIMSLQALLNDGDEILIPSPDYPLWTAAATLCGGKAVHYLCDETANWYPDLADIKKKVTYRTKAIVVINPNNPTGAVYPKEILEGIADIARENGLIVFSDEIYECLVMDGKKHISVASLAPDLFVVTMNGLSKSHRIAGFRVGWMCLSGDKSKAKEYIEGLDVLASMRLCSNVPSQNIIKTALENYHNADSLVAPGGRMYEQRECVVRAINNIPGLSVVKPEAAFYIFPKIDTKKFNIRDDEQFILDFLREQHILMVHGRGFHWEQPDHFRLVYLPTVEDLKVVTERLALFLQGYCQT